MYKFKLIRWWLFFVRIFISLCNKSLKTKQKHKQTNKQTNKIKDKFMTDTSTNRPILSMSKTGYFYCLNLFWMFSLLFCYSLFCSVLFSFVFVFVCFVFVCFVFVCFFRKKIICGGGCKPNAPPPPRGGADLKHGARRCEYLKTHFHVPKKD